MALGPPSGHRDGFNRQLFAVYDKKAERMFPPFASDNVATAIRQFMDLLSDPQSILARHPEDYCLYRTGHYDEADGCLYTSEKGTEMIEKGESMVGRPADVARADQEGQEKKSAWQRTVT